MKKLALGFTAVLLATLACNANAPETKSSQPDLATTVVETVQALTSNAPATVDTASTPLPATEPAATQNNGQLTPDGTLVETAEVSFVIPNGVANDATSVMTTTVEYPYINPSLGDMPQHVVVNLNLYAVNGSVFQPQIMIFKAAEFAQYSEMTTAIVSSLQTLQYTDGQPLPDGLRADFSAQIHALDFKNGHGIRYLTQVFQAFLPVNNTDLFYYYQGITEDGQYYVQAILPINAPYLSPDSNPNSPLPADGIPFNADDFSGYLNAVSQKLNTTETFNFSPYLDALDEMIASMQVHGF